MIIYANEITVVTCSMFCDTVTLGFFEHKLDNFQIIVSIFRHTNLDKSVDFDKSQNSARWLRRLDRVLGGDRLGLRDHRVGDRLHLGRLHRLGRRLRGRRLLGRRRSLRWWLNGVRRQSRDFALFGFFRTLLLILLGRRQLDGRLARLARHSVA